MAVTEPRRQDTGLPTDWQAARRAALLALWRLWYGARHSMRWAGFILVLVCGVAWAGEDRGEPVTVDAEKLSFQEADGQRIAVGEGNVVIRYQDAILQADRARYNAATKEAWAEGHVRLNRDGQEWVTDAIQYNFETRALKADEVRGFVNPVVVRGFGLEQTSSNTYVVAKATATTCDYDQPHYRLEARRAVIHAGQEIVLYNVTLRLGEVPVFWFPVLLWSLDGEGQPFTLAVGSSSRWGFFALTSTRFRLAPRAQLIVQVDGRTERGAAGGAEIRYRMGATGRGFFRGYYAQDDDPYEGLDRSQGKDLDAERYRLHWQHWQDVPTPWRGEVAGGDLELKIDLHRQSDTDVVDDFFPREFRREIEPQSVVDVTKRGENYTVSVLTRPQFNEFFAEVERLPEATWAVNRTRIGETPIFYEAVTRAGYLQNEPGDSADPVFAGHAFRAYTFQQVLVPARWFGWLAVVPRAGIGGAYYSDSPASSEAVKRALHHVGVETSFKLSRTWADVQNRRLGLNGLRHIVQPFANYHWLPPSDNRTNELWQFDTERFVTLRGGDSLSLARYLPVEIPSQTTIDSMDRQHFVRFGLRQKLQTRRDGAAWDLAELEGWTDWRAERRAGEDEFSDLFATLRLRPTRWLSWDTFARYGWEDDRLREVNSAVRVSGGDRWAVGLGSRYLRDDSNLVLADVAVRLGRRWVLQTFQRVDFEDGQWESQDYVLRQETHDWLISYGFRHRSQRTKDDEFAVYFAVTLKALPNIGLAVNQIDLGGD